MTEAELIDQWLMSMGYLNGAEYLEERGYEPVNGWHHREWAWLHPDGMDADVEEDLLRQAWMAQFHEQ